MELEIIPETELADSLLAIRIKHITPNSKVRLTAWTEDVFGNRWQANADFQADQNQQIDLAKQQPLSGSYHQVDPMGLIWSMRPKENQKPPSMFIADVAKPMSITFDLQLRDQTVASSTIVREFKSNEVVVNDVDDDQVKGKFLLPAGMGPHPAILLCPGSEGGIASQMATAYLLASHGYAVLVMAYFNFADLPKELYELSLERFQAGVQWLANHERVASDRMAMMGVSKGAEGFLAAASFIPEMNIKALIAVSPAHVIWQGFGKGKPENKSSWSLNHQALPYVKMDGSKIVPQLMLAKWIKKFHLQKIFPSLMRTSLLPVYSVVKKESQMVNQAAIPVENINAPLLLIAGKQDKMWPSKYMAEAIIHRRKKTRYAGDDELLSFQGVGHLFNYANLPTTISWMAMPGGNLVLNYGGRAPERALANRRAWQSILTFLDKHLKF